MRERWRQVDAIEDEESREASMYNLPRSVEGHTFLQLLPSPHQVQREPAVLGFGIPFPHHFSNTAFPNLFLQLVSHMNHGGSYFHKVMATSFQEFPRTRTLPIRGVSTLLTVGFGLFFSLHISSWEHDLHPVHAYSSPSQSVLSSY